MAILATGWSAGNSVAEDREFEAVFQAVRLRDFGRAADILEPLADAGNHRAQFYLATLYRTGAGRPRDRERFLGLISEASEGTDGMAERAGEVLARQTAAPMQKRTLAEAIAAGDRKTVNTLLAGSADPDSLDGQGTPALILAIDHGHEAVALALLDRGAPISACDRAGNTPLIAAAAAGSEALVAQLLDRGADPSLRNEAGWNAIDLARRRGHAKIVRRLESAGAKPTVTAKLERHRLTTPGTAQAASALLLEAVRRGRVPLLNQALAVQGIPRDTLNYALVLALDRSDNATLKRLLAAGADPNAEIAPDRTPLHLAAIDGDTAATRLLLDAGAQSTTATPPLLLAAARGHLDTTQVLLAAGASPNLADPNGRTALHLAAANGHAALVQLLLKNGADPGAADPAGQTALHLAAAAGNAAIVEALLAAGAKPDQQDPDGHTALMLAAAHGDQASVAALLAADASPDTKDRWGDTALLLAVRSGRPGCAAALLARNANPKIRNGRRERAVELARELGGEMAALFDANGEDDGWL